MRYYDMIIIGAGPAGATFARVADQKHRILLLDGNRRGKPCGGLLAPEGQKALARFDLNLPKEILADPQIFSVKTVDLNMPTKRFYQRSYVNLDRNRFDRWLLSLLPANVEVEAGCCKNITEFWNGAILVTYADSSGNIHESIAQTLIGADGANSTVRRAFFPELKTRKYLAIQQWFPMEDSKVHSYYSCIFDKAASDCCSWTISKDNRLIFGGAYPLDQSRKRFNQQKEKLAACGLDLGEPIKTEACIVLRPNHWKSFCLGKENIFLIGEAAGFISPSSLEGISYAMNSAVLLNRSIQSGKPGIKREYRRKTRMMRIRLLSKNIKGFFMYTPLLRKLILKSGIFRVRI